MINFRKFKCFFPILGVLPIGTRDHITVSQAQFAENGIGIYAGNGYSGERINYSPVPVNQSSI